MHGLRQDAGGVELDVRVAGEDRLQRAAYVVGTDGHRSVVRTLLGLEFPGHTVVESVMLADVLLKDPPSMRVATNTDGGKFAFIAPFQDGYHRVIAWDQDRPAPETAPVDLAELREVVVAALGSDFGMGEPRWSSRFHSDERQVERYQVGRVFLAGDAAHVHSPAGGQGMNTGLQDVANLGWKLAAVLQGRAPESLLETYHAERHPVGADVIKGSGVLLRLAQIRLKPARLLRNTAAHFALQRPAVNRKVTFALSGLWIAYDAPPGRIRPVGHRAGDVELVRRGAVAAAGGSARRQVRPALAPAELHGALDRPDVVAAVPADGGPVRLVRPDGYVGWAADAPTAVEVAGALEAFVGR